MRQKNIRFINKIVAVFSLASMMMLLFVASCKKITYKPLPSGTLVINEVMPSNRTGIMTGKGKLRDWIEIKNMSTMPVSLEGYSLMGKWTFPDTVIAGGECIVVYTSKKQSKKKAKELRANIKLDKDSGDVKLMAPDESVVAELKYENLDADQCLRRLEDGSYEKSYQQTPGFENNEDGFEEYCKLIEKQRKSPLKIWEAMSRSTSNNWVELKNVSDEPIELSDYSLLTKSKKRKAWKLPAKQLEPGGLFVVELAGKGAAKNDISKAPIKLEDDETIILQKDSTFMDGVCARQTLAGTSVGRVEGKKGFFFFGSPSRGSENHSKGYRHFAPMPMPSTASGVFKDERTMKIALNANNHTIHYTLNGSEPTSNSPVYRDSLVITKNTVLRAYAEGDSESLKSGVMTATYIFGVNHTIPIMCIAVDSADMYDYYTGIYVDGPGYTEEWPHKGANFYMDWMKHANAQLLNDGKGFQTDCGLRIFGETSRYEAKKSFSLKFKREYGNANIDYDFFGEGKKVKLKDLVLRSGSQDYNRCMIRDEFFTSLMAPECPTLLVQAYRPVALYINAEYFGLYYMREKVNKHFIARHLNVSSSSISIIEGSKYLALGSKKEYNELMQYITSHDMSKKECYDYVSARVDLQGLIDYKLGEIYSGNSDIMNIRYVRSSDKNCDGKWYFVFYDLDATFEGNLKAAKYLRVGPYDQRMGNVTTQNRMIDALLKNAEFRKLMKKRVDYHFSHTFTTENATKVFDDLVETIKPEMRYNCVRWPKLSYESWEENIKAFREKLLDRHDAVLEDIRQELKLAEK